MSAAGRSEVTFDSHGVRCAAWLYHPGGDGPHPLVILGHGLGAIKEMGLDPYAERFAEAGFAALVFDYRHFGASEGEPRQLLDVERQLEDWQAALSFARRLDGIDTTRLALWGSSFGGGHVIVAAARDGDVAAVVSQCPFTDGPSSLSAIPVGTNARLTWLGLRDQVAGLRRAQPVKVKLVGPPGSVALMTAPDAEPGYRGLIPDGVDFDDEVAARVALRLGLYRPWKSAREVRCPVLLCICDHDSVAPPGTAWRAVGEAPLGEVKRYGVGHFDIYRGEAFERAVADQLEFLERHLLAGARDTTRSSLRA
jgi:dienelactone hydrolase